MSHYTDLREHTITIPNQDTVPQNQFDQMVYERNQLLSLLLKYMTLDDILKEIKSQLNAGFFVIKFNYISKSN